MSLPQWQNRPVSWVLLDRDGVINRDSADYVRSAGQWQPLEGSIEAMARLQAAGCRMLVITNQSGIGRGYYD
ncbi:MAG: HAD-IIIA family hydrolase, partial [Gammaproteobacteria bacterium]